MLLSYGNTKCGPHWTVREETPPGYSRVYLVYSGDVTYEDSAIRTGLKCGNLYIFPSTQTYQMEQRIENPLICTFLHLDFFPGTVDQLIEIDMAEGSILTPLFGTIKECIHRGEYEMVDRLNDAFELYCRKHIIQPPSHIVETLLKYMRKNYNKKLTNTDLSRYLGYNEQYFVRMFRKHVGMSPHQYLINFRVLEAKAMMKTEKSLTAIAEETGFSDVKSFSRTFRQKTGMSPSAFRELSGRQP